MEASIKEPNIKNFVRLLQCAAKFGDDLNMHATRDVWELAVTNSSKSAFCLYKLHKTFFSRFRSLGTVVQQRKGVKCQLLVKSVLAVLGKPSSISNVERVDLKIIDPDTLRPKRRRGRDGLNTDSTGMEEDEYMGSDEERDVGGIESKLQIKLVCKHGVTKNHYLHLGISEFLRAEVDPNSTPSSFTISAKSLRDMLDHFSMISTASVPGLPGIKGDNQLGWMFGKKEVRVKSWEGAAAVQALVTEVRVDVGEFDEYWVEEDRVDLTLPMKEFRAALTLAEQLSVTLNIAFSEPTQPLTLTTEVEGEGGGGKNMFEIFCAIATTTCEAFSGVPRPGAGDGSDRKPTRSTSIPTSEGRTNGNGNARDKGKASAREPESQPKSASRPHSSSERPSKRQRPSLQMSDRARQPPSQASVYHSQQFPPEGESLFLPGGSQGINEADFGGFPRMSQSRVASQREMMEFAGMEDLGEDELADALDEAEEEDEREEEVLRASQAVGRQARASTVDDAGEEGKREFVADDEVFGDDQPREAENGQHAEDELMEDEEGEDEMPPTQRHGGQAFEQLFSD